MAELTAKQQAFVEEYLIDLNATQSAIRAGYSEKTAYSQGQRLLKNVEVASRIDEALAKRSERTEITADNVLRELAKLAFSNIEDYVRIDGEGLARVDLSEATRDQMAAVGEITVDTRREATADGDIPAVIEKVRFKLSDKGTNLERLGRHLKLFTDKTEVDTNITVNIDSKDAGVL